MWSNSPKTFEEEFPTIEDIRVEYREYNSSDQPIYDQPNISTKENTSLEVSCTNRICNEGGFRLRRVIQNMLHKQETNHQETIMCKGYEGSRRRDRSCIHSLRLNITIKYKEASE